MARYSEATSRRRGGKRTSVSAVTNNSAALSRSSAEPQDGWPAGALRSPNVTPSAMSASSPDLFPATRIRLIVAARVVVRARLVEHRVETRVVLAREVLVRRWPRHRHASMLARSWLAGLRLRVARRKASERPPNEAVTEVSTQLAPSATPPLGTKPAATAAAPG